MGIDKSIHEESPVAVIGGTVYQYGRSPEFLPWSDERWDPPQWIVEHHSYAKDYHYFSSEQEMLDFLDGLPETADPPFEWSPDMSEEERAEYRRKVREWLPGHLERKRQEKAAEPLTPAERYTKEARAMIDAVLDRHLKPHEWWDDPEIERQVGLILQHHLKLYREATGWTPGPMDEPDDDAQPTGYGGRPYVPEAEPVECTAVDWEFAPGPDGQPLLWYAKGTDAALVERRIAELKDHR